MSVKPIGSLRALQWAVAIGSAVPVAGGLAGIIHGPLMIPGPAQYTYAFDSHWRYLSGLLLAIGLGFWSTIPKIAQRGEPFRLLAGLVFVGGLARLVSLLAVGAPSRAMLFALAMELGVTPALALWQYRLAKHGI